MWLRTDYVIFHSASSMLCLSARTLPLRAVAGTLESVSNGKLEVRF
ncbi:MAG: hypothetical protein K2N20_07655 [Helicobacter sp.]|nr:hypothetical protein [Helicobacter sp.]